MAETHMKTTKALSLWEHLHTEVCTMCLFYFVSTPRKCNPSRPLVSLACVDPVCRIFLRWCTKRKPLWSSRHCGAARCSSLAGHFEPFRSCKTNSGRPTLLQWWFKWTRFILRFFHGSQAKAFGSWNQPPCVKYVGKGVVVLLMCFCWSQTWSVEWSVDSFHLHFYRLVFFSWSLSIHWFIHTCQAAKGSASSIDLF